MKETQLLWKNFLDGNREALASIFLFVHDDLYRYGLRLTGNESLVEDSIQDLFLRLWKNRANLKPVDNVRPYLFKSLRHHVLDNLDMVSTTIQLEKITETPVEMTYSIDDFSLNRDVPEETLLKMTEALNGLTDRQREAIFLRYFEELDFSMISVIMDMNVQSVRNTLHRALQSLRQAFMLLILSL